MDQKAANLKCGDCGFPDVRGGRCEVCGWPVESSRREATPREAPRPTVEGLVKAAAQKLPVGPALRHRNQGDQPCSEVFPREPEFWCANCLARYLSDALSASQAQHAQAVQALHGLAKKWMLDSREFKSDAPSGYIAGYDAAEVVCATELLAALSASQRPQKEPA